MWLVVLVPGVPAVTAPAASREVDIASRHHAARRWVNCAWKLAAPGVPGGGAAGVAGGLPPRRLRRRS